jgi:pimeloyl-ACP methyl ester carboxylesterase
MAQAENDKQPGQTLKILMLHGYTQSGTLFRAKTRFLETSLKKAFPANHPSNPQYPAGVELVYPTAPHRLRIADVPSALPNPSLPGPAHRGLGGGEEEEEEDSDSWAWSRKDEQTGEYVGIEASFDYLAELLRTQGPFTGVIGFSQGAAIATMLASLLEGAPRISSFAAHQSSGGIAFPDSIRSLHHPRFEFAVAYSGFLATDPRYAACFEPQIETPVLHVLGSLDGVVNEHRSLSLVKACVGGDERVVYHPGGHFVPGAKPYVGALVRFMRDTLRDQDKESGDAEANGEITGELRL